MSPPQFIPSQKAPPPPPFHPEALQAQLRYPFGSPASLPLTSRWDLSFLLGKKPTVFPSASQANCYHFLAPLLTWVMNSPCLLHSSGGSLAPPPSLLLSTHPPKWIFAIPSLTLAFVDFSKYFSFFLFYLGPWDCLGMSVYM